MEEATATMDAAYAADEDLRRRGEQGVDDEDLIGTQDVGETEDPTLARAEPSSAAVESSEFDPTLAESESAEMDIAMKAEEESRTSASAFVTESVEMESHSPAEQSDAPEARNLVTPTQPHENQSSGDEDLAVDASHAGYEEQAQKSTELEATQEEAQLNSEQNQNDDFVRGYHDEDGDNQFEFTNPIEICLFGESGRGPCMKETTRKLDAGKEPVSLVSFLEGDQDDHTESMAEDVLDVPTAVVEADMLPQENSADTDDTPIGVIDDSITSGRWGEAAALAHAEENAPEPEPEPAFPDDGQRYIDLDRLREIASQGIVDEGSHRAVAWRVLLGFLPTDQIDLKWLPRATEQRRVYHDLVQDYLDGRSLLDATTARGRRALRGHHSKKLRNQKMRNKFHQVQRLDYASSDEEDDEEESEDPMSMGNDSHHNSFSEHDESVMSELDTSQSSSKGQFPVVNHAKIMDRLPHHLRAEWDALGIAIDNTTPTASARSSNRNKKGPSPKKMLQVYSRAPSTWSSHVALYVNQLLVPHELTKAVDGEDASGIRRIFDEFVENAKALEEIRKDVVRTHPDLYFFLEPDNNLGLRRYAAVERILFLWATLNKGVKYVQGMNEIAATIYFVLANDVNGEWAAHAEPDAYFLFSKLMAEMRDVFMPEFDHCDTGLHGRIYNLHHVLIKHDPELNLHLDRLSIDPALYAIRWMTTMLSREFLLPDTIRLWDSMFASPEKEHFLRFVCATMVILIRDELLQSDFATCMKLLQDYPSSNVEQILESSRALASYEIKISTARHNLGMPIDQLLQMIPPPPAIIMAFGYPEGIPPMTEKEQLILHRSSSDSSQIETEQATRSGLVKRAKKMWNGWSAGPTNSDVFDSNTEEEPGPTEVSYEPDAIDLLLDAGPLIAAMSSGVASPIVEDFSIPSPSTVVAPAPVASKAPPPASQNSGTALRSRFWGMRRINSSSESGSGTLPTVKEVPTPSKFGTVEHTRSKSDSSAGRLPWMRRGNVPNWAPPLRARVWNRAGAGNADTTDDKNDRNTTSTSAPKIVSA